MKQKEKRLTKRERKALAPPRPPQPARAPSPQQQQQSGGETHIHCIACGRHLDPSQFDPPVTARVIECLHKSKFAACVGCVDKATALLAEHDRTGQPVKAANAWH